MYDGRRISRSGWTTMGGWLLAAALLAALGRVPAAAGAGAEKVFRAGACAMDITPKEFPVSSNGGLTDRQATSAHDPLRACCFVLDDGSVRLALVMCDSCMIPREVFDAAKAKAAAATGIPRENMLMAATHTHSAVTVAGVFQSEPETAYREFLTQQIAAGVEKAASQLEPARVGWGVGSDPDHVFNRRWFMKPGFDLSDPFGLGGDKVKMNPPRAHADLIKPAGPVDPQICLLSLQSRAGRAIGLLANYSLHYVGGTPSDMLSAGYFGEFAQRITQRMGAAEIRPPFVAAMSNGTSGDINSVNFTVKDSASDPLARIETVAQSVADAAFQSHQQIEHHEWAPLKMREMEIELGVRLPTQADIAHAKEVLDQAGPPPYRAREAIYARETMLLANYPSTVRVKLQAIRIGGLGIVSSPCETFVEIGLEIKQRSPLKPTFVVELANGYNGYLPTPEQHQLGGYETWRARSSYLAVDSASKVRDALLSLLREVAAEE